MESSLDQKPTDLADKHAASWRSAIRRRQTKRQRLSWNARGFGGPQKKIPGFHRGSRNFAQTFRKAPRNLKRKKVKRGQGESKPCGSAASTLSLREKGSGCDISGESHTFVVSIQRQRWEHEVSSGGGGAYLINASVLVTGEIERRSVKADLRSTVRINQEQRSGRHRHSLSARAQTTNFHASFFRNRLQVAQTQTSQVDRIFGHHRRNRERRDQRHYKLLHNKLQESKP